MSQRYLHPYLEEHADFSLLLGGPLFQLFRRFHLSNDAFGLLRRRIIAISLLAWAPLLLLSLWEGLALGAKVSVPFLADVDAQVRFLVALPLLIYAEWIVNERMRLVVRGFLDRKLVPEDSMNRLEAAMHSAYRLRNSVVAEILLIAFVYGIGVLVVWRSVALKTGSWYVSSDGIYTLTGIWYVYVSLPIFQFILIRWYFRLFIWGRFLWQCSRIPLNLIPTHPDRSGGLGFLSAIVYAFTPLLLAHGALLSGMIANRIFYLGAHLPQFKLEMVAMVAVILVFVLGPLLVFAPQLNRVKRKGLSEYGVLGMNYVREFDHKWLRGGAPQGELFVGSADIQSLADFSNSFQVIREMRLAPFTKEAILQLGIITLLPVLPLTLTMFSLEELLQRFLSAVF